MTDHNAEAKRHAVLAILGEAYAAGLAKEPPIMRQWSEELDQIYEFYHKHKEQA